MGKHKNSKKNKKKTNGVWTEKEYEEHLKGLYAMDFIAGYTEGGLPYGISTEDEDTENIFFSPNLTQSDD